jgi:NIMA (never in mitosis gene a)-related kinase
MKHLLAAGFQIDRKIGKGQFSVVYRAKALHNGMVVALKKVQIFEMMDSKARLDCMKEIQLLQVEKWSARGL